MPKHILCLALSFLFALCLPAQNNILSPDDFLPHSLGEQFTRHHQLVDYYEYVASVSDRVRLSSYGLTNEDRPLLLGVVSAPENLEKLETIIAWNQWQAGFQQARPTLDKEYSIVWLSFGVHGNEAGASESSMRVLFELVNGSRPEVTEWLENTIVLLDPSINPDGYARYTNWYRSIANQSPDPARTVREHREPWPGGRVNHYLFDLNRDWAWATQVETQQRMLPYQEWLPHIHVDFHEQFPDDPYYFAPAAKPFHTYITEWQREFQTTIGQNNADYFDSQGWLYYTREVFDLLYPSYGDTYPTFNGAIGMTYEQAGHGMSGRAIEMENGDTLSLEDRVAHHTAAALSTIEVAAANVARVNLEFRKFFEASKNTPPGPYQTYIIKGTNTPAKIKALTQLLDVHRIEYKKAGLARRTSGLSYEKMEEEAIEVVPGDLIISTNQPKGLFVQVLFDPVPEIEDSLTYDITAWSLVYAYGLEAFASRDRFDGREAWVTKQVAASNKGAYAYAHTWTSVADAHFLGKTQLAGLKARYSNSPFVLEGVEYPAGTVVYTRADNRKVANWDGLLTDLAKTHEQPLKSIQTGFSDAGHDLGSEAMRFIQMPNVLMAAGEQTDANSFGHAWHYFEQVLQYPISILDAEDISASSLENFNVLVLPDGRYQWGESELKSLQSWVRKGGKVIALGSAVNTFSGKDGFQLKSKEREEAKAIDLVEDLIPYAERDRNFLSDFIPGAIFKLKMDNTHPLAFGMDPHYFSLKVDASAYSLLDRGWNVGAIGKDPLVLGFAGENAVQQLNDSMVYGVERMGSGSMIYLVDNPLFRGFWYQGQLLMASALFF